MDNRDENQENATRKVMKIVVRRLQKYKKMKVRRGSWDNFFQLSPDVATNFRKNPAKLAPRCAKSRPRWAKMATRWPKMGQDGNEMAILALTWEVLVRSWLQLVRFVGVPGRILEAFVTILADALYIPKP